MLKSLVIVPNERTKDLGAILQIARSLVQRKEQTDANVPIVSLVFDPSTRVYIAIYEWCSNPQEQRKQPNNV